VLLPFVLAVWHSIPRHSAPCGLLPNMSESSGNPGREPRSGFFCLSVSLAEPCPRLTRVLTVIVA